MPGLDPFFISLSLSLWIFVVYLEQENKITRTKILGLYKKYLMKIVNLWGNKGHDDEGWTMRTLPSESKTALSFPTSLGGVHCVCWYLPKLNNKWRDLIIHSFTFLEMMLTWSDLSFLYISRCIHKTARPSQISLRDEWGFLHSADVRSNPSIPSHGRTRLCTRIAWPGLH